MPSVFRLVRSWSTLGRLSRLVVGPAAEVGRADCVAVRVAGSNVAAIPAKFDLGPRANLPRARPNLYGKQENPSGERAKHLRSHPRELRSCHSEVLSRPSDLRSHQSELLSYPSDVRLRPRRLRSTHGELRSNKTGLRSPSKHLRNSPQQWESVFVGCVESSRRTGPAIVVRLEDSTHPTELCVRCHMIGCHTARKPLLFMCLRGVNDYELDVSKPAAKLL